MNPNIYSEVNFLPSAVINNYNNTNTDKPQDLPQESFDVNEKKNVEPKSSTNKDIVSVIHDLSPVPNTAEDWIICQACNQWANEACTDVEEGSVSYICYFCSLHD